MEYLGEWIGVAYAGRFLVALAFVSALMATVAFWKGNLHLGRRAYLTHAGSTLGVIALIFVLFFGHRYEFQYIWKHLNNAMPMRFVLQLYAAVNDDDPLKFHRSLYLFISPQGRRGEIGALNTETYRFHGAREVRSARKTPQSGKCRKHGKTETSFSPPQNSFSRFWVDRTFSAKNWTRGA